MNLIIDGNNIAIRSHFKMPHLTNRFGVHTGAMHGFLTSLLRLKTIHKPERIIICWDGGRADWRMKLCPEYKANRDDKQRDAVHSQFQILRGIIECLPVSSICLPGVEADDLIAKFVLDRIKDSPGDMNIIHSNDEDFLQLVTPNTKILKSDGTFLTRVEFAMKHKVEVPFHVILKSLVGDSSDNISGLPKIGKVKAVKMIEAIGSKDPHDYVTQAAFVCYSGMDSAIREISRDQMMKIFLRNTKMMDLHYGATLLPYVGWTPNAFNIDVALKRIEAMGLNSIAAQIDQFAA